jgi:hypothetical protein
MSLSFPLTSLSLNPLLLPPPSLAGHSPSASPWAPSPPSSPPAGTPPRPACARDPALDWLADCLLVEGIACEGGPAASAEAVSPHPHRGTGRAAGGRSSLAARGRCGGGRPA